MEFIRIKQQDDNTPEAFVLSLAKTEMILTTKFTKGEGEFDACEKIIRIRSKINELGYTASLARLLVEAADPNAEWEPFNSLIELDSTNSNSTE